MNHFASRGFWRSTTRCLPTFKNLPTRTSRCFALLRADPSHPSLHFKKVGRFRSARVGLQYRALSVEVENGLLWFWFGTHVEYEQMINR